MSVDVKLRFLLLLFHWHTTIFAQKGEFPQPVPISWDRPVFASSACGEVAETYCQYNDDNDIELSLSPNCISAVCDKTCSYSSSSPLPIDVTVNATIGTGVVTSLDSAPGPGSTDILEFTNSFIASSSAPEITSNGFTFAVWVKQDSNNNGALLSKANSDGTTRGITVSVTETSVVFNYLPNTADSGFSTLTFSSLDLSSSFWHHVAVTVYDNDFALYINGTIESADGLSAPINTSIFSTVYIGQIAPNINQYNGLMQDIFTFSQALTAREIEELVTGELPFIHLQNECRCPPSHPLINSVSPNSCTQHTGITTNRGSAIRLNSLTHPAGFVNDKNVFTTSWISEIDLQQSNVTMNLVSGSNSAYELVTIIIRYSSTPAKAAVLEKTIDGGETFSPLQYFASDCSSYFGMPNNAPLQSNDDVNCKTEYSSQSLGVTAQLKFTDGTRGSLQTSNTLLSNFVLSDGIRLRLIDYFTLNTTAQHRYYGISDITVLGRCACNGHAVRCTDDATALCDCTHNTQGDRCEECLPLYNDKPWREGTNSLAFPCKQCSCNNHATACHYNASIDSSPDSYDLGGGGVCDDCQDNTAGNNCEICVFGYYRKAGVDPSDSEPCTECGCDSAGATGEDCVKHEGIPGEIVGQCDCKENVEGLTCDECKTGFFGLSANNSDGCEPCNCNTNGTVSGSESCNTNTGQCVCKANVEGLKCDQCVNGTAGLDQDNPDGCSVCNCDELGSLDGTCDLNSNCICKPGVGGSSCDQCKDGFYGLSVNGCQQCQCSEDGSINSTCDANDGTCYCKTGFTGSTCDECAMGYFQNTSVECVPCQCHEVGTVTDQINSCNITTGQCQCKSNVIGRDCDSCALNYTNLQDSGCTACDCVLSNTNSSAAVLCDPVTLQCACLPSAGGLKCDSCSEGYFASSDGTCEECGCDTVGSNGTGCTPDAQCDCLNENITGLTCSQCKTGHYDFPNCLQCSCNASGSVSSVCDSGNGVCQCKQFVTGMNCDTCVEGYSVLQASNPFGCTAAPEEQAPPTAQTVLARSILISWLPPEKPNGIIALYSIRRNGTLIDSVPGSILTFNDTGLVPNTPYQYTVESENIAGSTVSDPVTISTLEGTPEGVNSPIFTVINSTSLNAVWTPPNTPNGIIANYNLILVSVGGVSLDSPVTQFSGSDLSYVVTGLSPFTVHTFRLEACTSQACGSSPEVNATTLESAPEYQPTPTLTSINSTAIMVSWTEPPTPNGVIIKYEVRQRSSPFSGNGVLIENVSSDVLSVIVGDLQPFTEYEFSVSSFTEVGGTQSNWTRENTHEIVPEDLIEPTVTPISSTELHVQWSEPSTPNGVITLYQIFVLYPDDNSTDNVANYTSTGSHTVMDLSPYTQYGVYVVVCNVAGCSTTGIVYSTTLEGIPSGLKPPRLSNITGSSISLDWDPPSDPNGVIVSYSITRQEMSLEASPSQRDVGTAFHGADYASYPPVDELQGLNFEISLMFKTLVPDGVLLYYINSANTDLIAIELRSGVPWLIYDAGSGPAVITVDANGTRFDDGQWHTLEATRTGNAGTLTVDDSYTGSGFSLGLNTFIGKSDVLYVGGLRHASPLITNGWEVIPNATLDGLNFAGCLFDIKLNGELLDLETILNPNPSVGSPSAGCPLNRERGVSFLGGGFISLPYTSPQTDPFSFSIQFRTTRSTSLLFFAYSMDVSSYIAVMLKDSDLIVQIKSSDTEISLSSASLFIPDSLCNGNWYSLDLSKESNGITFKIDNQTLFSPLQNSLNVSTMSNLYIGGTPVSSDAWDAYFTIFSMYPVSFSGCFKSFVLDGVAMDLHRDFGDSLEHVRFDGCDSNTDLQSCTQGMTEFGLGSERTLIDNANLSPFTEYLYRVSARNSVSETKSSWSLGMTGENKPDDAGSVNVTSRTSSSLQVMWSLEGTTNGLITHYEVRASPLNTTGLETPIGLNRSYTLSVESPTQELSLELTGLEPATTYSCILNAFNGAGSGSGPAVIAATLEDVPFGVSTPTGLHIGSNEVTVQWDAPMKPNGIIVLYRVYIDGSAIETTNRQATVQSLEPFRTYPYHLEACTVVGCTNGTGTTILTSEGMPDGLAPPTLTPLSSQTVRVNWASPSDPNGIITHYEVLRVFGVNLSQTELIANSTELSHVVTGLSPNTVYYFKVVAHNSVGSVTSNTSSVLTLEDTPEMISPPSITVINSTALLITWEEPLQPNGIITNYTLHILYKNESVIFGANSLSYTDTNLNPFTEYSYYITVCNSKGCGDSITSVGLTAEAVPEGLQPPTIVSTTSESAVISFEPAAKPNGKVSYIVRVIGEFLVSYNDNNLRQTVTEMREVYNDTETSQEIEVGDLIPYTAYIVQLEASTSAGSALEDSVPFTTLQAAPELLSPPQAELITSTSLRVSWTPPTYLNDEEITSYDITTVSHSMVQSFTVDGNTTSTVIHGLDPYTNYSVSITASNIAGNVTSDDINIITGETVPSDFDQPLVSSVTPYSISISWDPPASPNGVIIHYIISITSDELDDVPAVTVTVPAQSNDYDITGLQPFTEYNVTVEGCNSAGCVEAPVIIEVTNEAAPQVLAAPDLSTLPNGVIITWTEPQDPNGLILTYTVQRSPVGGAFTVIQTVPVMDGELDHLTYTDTDVLPFTEYWYRVEASNSAGSVVSNYSSVLTQEDAPEDVPQPILTALNSSSISITIQPPQTPNGIITRYTINRLIEGGSITVYTHEPDSNDLDSSISYIDTSLSPYTVYQYTVTAFTVAGNTTSNVSSVRTLEAPPFGIQPPSTVLTGDTSILIAWNPKFEHNGVIVSYSLIRVSYFGDYSIAADVINTDLQTNCHNYAADIDGSGESDDELVLTEVDGDITSYIDQGLDPYTYYGYCVIASNGAGSIASGPSNIILTSPAVQPTAGPNVTASTINSTAINVTWTGPHPMELLGPLTSYILYVKESGGGDGVGSEVVSGLVYSLVVTGLTPSTTYTFTVAVNNSRGIALSTPTDAKTSDGIPVGVVDPVAMTTGSDSIFVSWVEPLIPNGEIIRYSILLNGELYLNQSIPGSISITGLKPFTVYVFRLEVCTELGCALSGQVTNRTFESAPTGLASPFVNILGPYSAAVSWMSPVKPNGIVTAYNLYMREKVQDCSDISCYEKTLVFTGYAFNYTVTGLSPNTQYGFEVVAQNGGGNVSSGFTTVTTDEAPPTLVFPPDTDTISAYSINIEWEVPLEPNGIIVNYYVYRDDDTVVYSGNDLTTIDTSLTPFAKYCYTVGACTNAGCTNSTEGCNSTLEAIPEGFATPIVTGIGAYSVNLSWAQPSALNGENENYIVSFTNGTEIASGLIYSVTVEGLAPFTNYTFFVSVFNTEFSLDSSSISVVTLEIPPTGMNASTVKTLSSTAVEISWLPPSSPNGIITTYILRRDGMVIFNGTGFTHDDIDLTPNTQYTYTVEAVNSAGSVVSPILVIQTQADLPSGVSPPTATVLSSTSIYIEWTEPESNNGEIMAYKLIVNDQEVVSGLVFNHTLINLTPYTNYTLYIQVCNQVGCASSKSVTETTHEELPLNLVPPVVTGVTSTTVTLSWVPPTLPNGLITSYRIVRRETNNPLLILVQYVGVGDVTTFTNEGLSPYTSYEYQLVAFNSIGSVESDWTEVTTLEAPPTGMGSPTFPDIQSEYVVVSWNPPANPNGVLTRYDVSYRPLLGDIVFHESLPANTTQTNVTGLEPFTIYEFRIEVYNNAGKASSDFTDAQTLEGAPEGLGNIILVTKTSESVTVMWAAPLKPNGIISEYVLYLNGIEEYRDTPRMAFIDRLKPFTSYSILLEACTSAACSQGEIQGFTTEESDPIGQPSPELTLIGERAVSIEWGFPIQSNGLINSYEIFRSEVPEPLVDNTTDVDATVIYVTDDVSNRAYNDTGLTPDTGYVYAVRANNSVGSSLSSYEYIQTPQAAPENVQGPVLNVLGTSSIGMTWDPPLQKNGELTQYQIYRATADESTVKVYTGLNREFTDTGLKPYTQYLYTVEACTIAGCGNSSSPSTATTDESIPESIIQPELQALSSSSISVKWSEPSVPNGVLVSYIVNVVSPVLLNSTHDASVFEATISSLEPFTVYTVTVQACTVVGCVTSNSSSVLTQESVPMLQGAPTVFALSPSSVSISWQAPDKPNGIIVNYILRRNGTIIHDNNTLSYVDTGLLPNQAYSYDVQSFTSVGGGDPSSISTVTTHADTPEGVSPPTLTPLDSTSILAQWTVPDIPNGVIQKYILYVNESVQYEGMALGTVVLNLGVFTMYSFRVEACTTTCGSSVYSYAITMEAAPVGLDPPTLSLSSNESVLVSWLPPSSPNGIITTYSIDRAMVTNGDLGTITQLVSDIPAPAMQYIDDDSTLSPATTYSYRVTAANTAGSVTSEFTSITLPDGTPQNLSAPSLVSLTDTSFTVTVTPPAVANGVLTKYTLFGDNLFPIVATPTNQEDPVLFTHSELDPYTVYRVYAEVCTVGGCVLGPATEVRTNESTPAGLLSPFVTVQQPRRILVEWSPPTNPNGVITGYKLYYKLPCPQPTVTAATTTQCTETEYSLVTSTDATDTQYMFDSISTPADHPYPYTSYQFVLEVENNAGAVNSSETDVITTDDSVPEQINDVLFNVYSSNQSIALNWGSTFRINGQLKSYTVLRDGVFLFIGTQTYAVFPNQPVNTVLKFSVRVSNANYQFTTPSIPLQITIDDVVPSVTMTTPTASTNTTEPTSTSEFYTEPAFVVGMVILAVIICFVLILVCLCLIRPDRSRTADKYNNLTSEKGDTPNRGDGTIASGWTHEPITPVPSYNDALHNYASAPHPKSQSSYSPLKAEAMSSQLNDSYSPQSKVDLASYRQLQQADELPLLDTHIARLSVIEEIPMKDFTTDKQEVELELEPAGTANEESFSGGGEDDEVTLKKNMELTGSQEFILDTAI